MTTLVWRVGLTLGNTFVGVWLFGDPLGAAKAAGLASAVATLLLLSV